MLGGEWRAAGALCSGDEVQHRPASRSAAHHGEIGELWTITKEQLEDNHVRLTHSQSCFLFIQWSLLPLSVVFPCFSSSWIQATSKSMFCLKDKIIYWYTSPSFFWYLWKISWASRLYGFMFLCLLQEDLGHRELCVVHIVEEHARERSDEGH